jgi:hypothetical protein
MKTTVKITILLILGMITKGYGQISVNFSPTYNIIRQDYTVTGLGIEAGIRFRSSKIIRFGVDLGYNKGFLRTPQVVSIFDDRITLYSGEHSYIPAQGIIELQTQGTKFRALLGGGVGIGWWNVKETSGLISGHIGLSYRLNERLQILTKVKYLSGTILNPMADASNGFNSFNASIGMNYQFNNK